MSEVYYVLEIIVWSAIIFLISISFSSLFERYFCKGYFNSLDPSDGYGYPRGCSRIGFEVETNPRKKSKRTEIPIEVPEPPKPEVIDYMVIMGAEYYGKIYNNPYGPDVRVVGSTTRYKL